MGTNTSTTEKKFKKTRRDPSTKERATLRVRALKNRR